MTGKTLKEQLEVFYKENRLQFRGETAQDRKLNTLKAVKELLEDKNSWEDPGYPYFRIVARFVKILCKFYYTEKTVYFRNRMIKKLSMFGNKYTVYGMVFSWYHRLSEELT